MALLRRMVSAVVVTSLAAAPVAWADDASWTGGMELGDIIYLEHEDSPPWAGWVHVEVTNTGVEPWGDFHFEIFSVFGYDISNVDFWVHPPYEPVSSQNLQWWEVDNDAIGATLDLFFYGDWVYPGETATFSVYTHNADQIPFFGVAFYPTPIPEPAALALLGIAALLARRR